jgi:microcystin-dependent protein
MLLNWSDFSMESGVEDTPLLLSERSIQIALTAIGFIESFWVWRNPSSDWNDIEIALANAIEELSKATMPDFTPVGLISPYAHSEIIPDKWLLCNGNGYPSAGYPELFALIGTKYGTSGADTFRVPDLNEKFVLGQRNDDGDFVIDETGGTKTHTLTTSEMPAHAHVQNTKGSPAGAVLTTAGFLSNAATPVIASTTSTATTGGGGSHNNMPPYHSLAWIIKALP